MDLERFRCLKFAYEAGKAGGSYPTVLNAANEAAVGAFLKGAITFLQIEDLVEKALNQHQMVVNPSLPEIEEIDRKTRNFVQSHITK